MYSYFCYILPESYDINNTISIISESNDLDTTDKNKPKMLRTNLMNSDETQTTIIRLQRYTEAFQKFVFTICYSVIGYYGGHYINYSFKNGTWYLFDDHTWTEVGDYTALMEKMARYVPPIFLESLDEKSYHTLYSTKLMEQPYRSLLFIKRHLKKLLKETKQLLFQFMLSLPMTKRSNVSVNFELFS